MSTIRPAALVAAFALSASACFAYAPVRPERLSPGSEVRVRVSQDALARLEPQSEAQPTRLGRTISGRFVQNAEAKLLLEVPVPTGGTAFEEHRSLFRRVAIPVGDILEVEVRRLERGRTALLCAGGAAALAALVLPFLSGQFGGTTRPGQ